MGLSGKSRLKLNGADCYFWVMSHSTRWHYSSNPLKISEGKWADDPLRFILRNDESLWHMSWTNLRNGPATLDTILKSCISYGFSFIGFGQEVRGKLSMDEFQIKSDV